MQIKRGERVQHTLLEKLAVVREVELTNNKKGTAKKFQMDTVFSFGVDENTGVLLGQLEAVL